MMRIVQAPTWVCLIVGLAACRGPEAPRPGAAPPPQVARIEHGLLPAAIVRGEDVRFELAERMRKYQIPGISIAVIDHGQIAWAKGYGVADASTGAPVTEATLFQAASISKSLNAAAALLAVSRGALTLDGPINAALSQWKLADNALTRATPVTLRQLLSHTAGTNVHGFGGYEAGLPLPTLVQLLDGAPPANSPKIVVDVAPGTAQSYSGGGIEIVQLALTERLARPYAAILADTVLGPVGMTRSTFEQPLPANRLAEAAAGHVLGAVIPGKRNVYPEQAAAGLWTTPTDLAKFFLELYRGRTGGSRAIPQAIALQMTTVNNPAMPNGGLGVWIRPLDGVQVFGHDGGNNGFECHATITLDGSGLVIMTNAGGGNRIVPEIERAVFAAYGWRGGPASVERAAITDEARGRLVGVWSANLGDPLTIARDGERLVFQRPFGEPMELVPVAGGAFVGRDDGARYDLDGDSLVRTQDSETQRWTRLDPAVTLPLLELTRGERGFELAVAAHRALRARDPRSPAVDEGLLNQAAYHVLRDGNVTGALAILRLNAAVNPDSANALDSLGEAYAASGDTARAITSYEAALAALPRDRDASPAVRQNVETHATVQLNRLRAAKR